MSFFCPHFDVETEQCLRLDVECVPGRNGCVLGRKTVFAVPPEQRVKDRRAKPPSRPTPPADPDETS
ncbi:MAG: hypothetical protein D6766_00165 [Verrucomicrobia bacterium]|nr:MAG: hypothetical protein D6766_00165 [Verrucomicrobiota bacterium]